MITLLKPSISPSSGIERIDRLVDSRLDLRTGEAEKAVEEAGIRYPVVLDNNDATWDAYDNRYWPARYLIDADGFIRYQHLGEGAYEENEAEIQELLSERDQVSS